MNDARPRLRYGWLFSAFMLLAATEMARADYMELLRRAPDSANTLIMIDVERLLMSPIAMKEKWRDKANSSDGEPLHFPVNAEHYMLASKVDYVSSFDDVWDTALIETTSDISLPYLSKMEGGYLDTVEGQQVAFSPRNAFLVLFKPRILGLSFPANKQDLGPGCGKSIVATNRRSRSISSMPSWWRMARITSSLPSTSETCSRAGRCVTGSNGRRALRERRSISTGSRS